MDKLESVLGTISLWVILNIVFVVAFTPAPVLNGIFGAVTCTFCYLVVYNWVRSLRYEVVNK